MEGGFFLIQRVDARAGDRQITGVESVGFDEDTQTLRSHYMDVHGANFTDTWEIDGDTIRIWFGGQRLGQPLRGPLQRRWTLLLGRLEVA